ncbi:BTAD domain-containing putative transcriptional regulator [Streptomyces sp. NPDC006733]|uniref:AfsR/SARP family transcriptional regulator n=1 Tax=Streptomyces sp. NPDC006733 TaxID=3155460 RepID=UPI00340C883A
MAVEFKVLGSIEASVDGRPVALGHARQRGVLAVLLADVDRPVTTDQLVDRVWGERQPRQARSALHSYLSRLRQALAPTDEARIVRHPGSYSLTVADTATVDLRTFRRLVVQARATRDEAEAAALFEQALRLWRAEAFATMDTPWINALRGTLDRERFAAQLDLGDLQLRLGHHAALLPELSARAEAHPLDERVAGQLMLALHRSGRTADALDHYQRVRRRLSRELGLDPGAALRDIEAGILRQDTGSGPAEPVPATRPVHRPGPMTVPAQLPLAVAAFTGRESELARLDALLPGAGPPRTGAVVISAVSGTAGVGKTTLAVHWARRVRDAFPDGQLYANLRGFDPSGSLVTPMEAVRGFLDALGVPPARIPAGLEAQAGLYRSILADRRVLVVLDNARDAEQVRPLLPGASGCLALVTSRNRLTGLAATEGAQLLTVDLLAPGQARELLAGRLGARRVAEEPAAVEEIVARCAGLPLALAIAAAHGAAQPGFPLAALAGELREAGSRLDVLDGGDPVTQVRAVFSWSYATLSPDAARLFRLLGVHPGPDISVPAAAGLAGVPPAAARAALAELTRAHLLTEQATGRFAFHDLLRAYAAELAGAVDTDTGRRAAVHRMLDHYLHTAHLADRLLGPPRDRITPAPARPGVVREELTDHGQALAWLSAEHPVLTAVFRQAVQAGFDTHIWQLATVLATFHQRRALWSDWTATHTAALAAGHRLDDRRVQAGAHRNLGSACSAQGRHGDALTHLQQALALYREAGDRPGEAQAHLVLGGIWSRQNHPEDALVAAQRALELFREEGDRAWQGQALNNLGWYQSQRGDHHQALELCQQALALVRGTGHVTSEAHTWDSLGYAHHHLGQYDRAVDCYQHAAELFSRLGDRYHEADILAHLGDTHHAARNPAAAQDTWARSLAIFEDLDHPDAAALRGRLLHHLGRDPDGASLPVRE